MSEFRRSAELQSNNYPPLKLTELSYAEMPAGKADLQNLEVSVRPDTPDSKQI